ncbi:MAG: TonB-dependent receptor domain-containing protein [Terriglobales bacterium]
MKHFLRLLLFALISVLAVSQSITSGDISGVVTDPSGAVVPNAKVTVVSDATGETHTANSNGQGVYRFSFLKPGSYTVSATSAGLQAASHRVQVGIGQVATANIGMTLTAASTTVDVTTSTLQIDNADLSTTFSNQQISLVPNPGNDLSAVAQTAPGAIMNTQGGFGNFSTYGLPGTSNLFTLNGQNDNDPFLNLNNSGATNLLLGINDVQEATVTNNGYSGQYGQLAGSQVNYVSKSGENSFHGNAIYYWNGRVMNANDYLNNLAIAGSPSTPRPFDNVNQWAASFGGPIKKDRTFFFFNYEGLRVIIPTAAQVRIPTAEFQAATLANLAGKDPAAIPFYQNMFGLYNAVHGSQVGTGSCSTLSVLTLAGPCFNRLQTTQNNFTHEYQMSLRIDQKFSDKDSIFGRVQTDQGVQATFTDPINPAFNTQSTQPEYQGQLSETHLFGSSAVNEFKLSGQWYTAFFDNPDRQAALAIFPTTLAFSGGFSRLGGINFNFPQGRNVTQYQIVDDYSLTRGKHTFKFGVNYHRNDVTDFDYGVFTSGEAITGVDAFVNGQVDFFQQNFPTRFSQPIALYGLGFYGQDEWRVTDKLKLTLALRLDHNSNPVCQTNCFSELAVPFTSLVHDPNIPYNQAIRTGLHQAYPSTDGVVWQPRLGFTFSPFSSNKTVVRGGIGIFGDSFPAVLVDNFSSNPPVLNSFQVAGALSPASAGNVFQLASGANKSFVDAFNNGGTLASITASNPFFFPPSITASDPVIRQPRYQEWNLQVEQDLGWNSVLSFNYVGNHGIFEAALNNGLNAFGFGGLPAAAPDPRFSTVTQVQSIAVSNYNGLVTSLRHNFNRGFAFQLNYTWSHALDEISNGGLLPFNFNTNTSILNPVNPFNIRQNYGNADYDVRHYFSANYVWSDSLRHLFKWGPNAVFGGWTISGTVFARSGLPFSVIDSDASATLNAQNYGGTILADVVGPSRSGSCGRANATPDPATGNPPPPCLNFAGFASPTSVAVNQARNQFRGPHFFDTDLTVMKNTKLGEKASLGLGVQFFNLFNHPNFDQPIADIAAGSADPVNGGSFGTIVSTVNTPTSILGSFLGGNASPRLIQLKAEFKF